MLTSKKVSKKVTDDDLKKCNECNDNVMTVVT